MSKVFQAWPRKRSVRRIEGRQTLRGNPSADLIAKGFGIPTPANVVCKGMLGLIWWRDVTMSKASRQAVRDMPVSGLVAYYRNCCCSDRSGQEDVGRVKSQFQV